MFKKKTVRDVPVQGKIVLVRADYNVPLDASGKIEDDLRIRASLPTLKYLLDNGAKKIIVMSHLGRPKGERKLEYSLKPVAEDLARLLPGVNVGFVGETTGEEVAKAVAEMPEHGVLLLENLRFDPREEQDDMAFAEEIATSTGAELFVQDGFAVVHRAHASTDAIARILPAVAGFLVENEVSELMRTLEDPARPLVVIIGGAKVDDKQGLIEAFLPIADKIVVGGKIAADGYHSDNPKVYIAEDFVENEDGLKLDLGRKSTEEIIRLVKDAGTVFWNGVLGKVEEPDYALSSEAVARVLGRSSAKVVIGGGDTAAFVEKMMEEDPELSFDLISTGGGASLELLSGKKLPGVEVLLPVESEE